MMEKILKNEKVSDGIYKEDIMRPRLTWRRGMSFRNDILLRDVIEGKIEKKTMDVKNRL